MQANIRQHLDRCLWPLPFCLTASRRGRDKRCHRRSAAISHNQHLKRCGKLWQHVLYLWQNVRAWTKYNKMYGMFLYFPKIPWPSLEASAPNLPTKIIPTKIHWLNISGKFPMDMRIPPLTLKILPESNPLKSRILVRRLAMISSFLGSGASDFKFKTRDVPKPLCMYIYIYIYI